MSSLFGLETEYAIQGLDAGFVHRDPGTFARLLLAELERSEPHLPGVVESGVFLANGSRFYIDMGGHPELATCETSSPEDAVRYLLAGERILYDAARRVVAAGAAGEIALFRTNVDYLSLTTWGSHESYAHVVDDDAVLARELIPHFVSRVVYSGAGGLSPLLPGITFTLSPRAPFFVCSVSANSTAVRGIFNLRNQDLCSGFRRLHVICGESLGSQVANYLRVGTTALILRLVELGRQPGAALSLADAPAALREIVGDPTCRVRVRLANGKLASALEMQRSYLEAVEEMIPSGALPAWASEVVSAWRSMLERLRGAPDSVARVLDWGVKYAHFGRQIERFSRASVASWNEVLAKTWPPCDFPHRNVDRLDADEILRLALLGAPEWLSTLRERSLTIEGLEAFCAFRATLRELDARFGELGPSGLWEQLDRAGVLAHRIIDDAEIETARSEPPRSGRARLRGEWVQRLSQSGTRQRARADWSWIFDPARHEFLDLSDPFETSERWRPPGPSFPDARSFLPFVPNAPGLRDEREVSEFVRHCMRQAEGVRARSLSARLANWLRFR
jgi:proteasome accessory factor A